MVLLSLGDIIKIIATRNDAIHDQTFFIDYIDNEKIKLINIGSENLTKYELTLKDANFTDESIEQIQLLNRASEEGFARQNGLLPGTWLEIHFGGDLPQIFVGEVTDLEEDMIEVRTFPDRDYIYIDFAYKGVPENLPILKFVVREPPTASAAAAAAAADDDKSVLPASEEAVDIDDSVKEVLENPVPTMEAAPERGAEEDTTPEIDIREVSRQLFFRADEIVLGKELESITEVVEVERGQERYGLDTQINDMMDQLLATVPNHQRSKDVLSRIHTTIQRFKVLREQFSRFDDYGVVTGTVKKGANYKPFLEVAANLDVKLKWFLPVVNNARKLFMTKDDAGAIAEGADDGDDDVAKNVRDFFTELKEEIDAENETYYKNTTFNPFQNKYVDYMQSKHAFLTPHDNGGAGAAGAGAADVLIKRRVNTNLEAVISNLEDFYSTVYKNDQISRRRYVIQRYNLGATALQPDERGAAATAGGGKKTVFVRKGITPNDTVAIKSFLVLPEPVVRFSAIDMPNTNIFTRANLNQNYFSLWRVLTQRTYVDRKYVPELLKSGGGAAASAEGVGMAEAEGGDFLSHITEYVLDETEAMKTRDELGTLPVGGAPALEETNLIKLLDNIVPRTKVLFQIVKKYMTDQFTFLDVIKYMEPFMVYGDDISYKQYTNIRWFLKHQITDIKKSREEMKKKFGVIRSTFERVNVHKINTIYDLFLGAAKKDALEVLIKLYNLCDGGGAAEKDCGVAPNFHGDSALTQKALVKNNKLSSSEMLARVLEQDDATLFTNTLANLTLGLTSHEDILSFVDKYQISDIGELEKLKPKNKELCAVRKFSKKYTSAADLKKDDGTEDVFYDKEYDTTPYKVLDEPDVKRARKAMPAAKFAEFLKTTLVEKYGFSDGGAAGGESEAAAIAQNLIMGKRRIAEGDYAILVDKDLHSMDVYEFFRRQGNAWVKDAALSEEITTPEEFCKLRAECSIGGPGAAGSGGECNTLETLAIKARQAKNKQIVDAFSERVKLSVQEIRDQIVNMIEKNTKILRRRKMLRELTERRSNEIALALAKDLNKMFEQTTPSPYTALRDHILSQTDYVKKQNMVLQFVARYCSELSDDDPHWLYCKETSTRLLPYTIYLMADAFVHNNENFMVELGKICARYGAIDEDRVVDKHTGYTLRMIDFSTDEGYDENGFKISTHDVLEDTRTMEEKLIEADAAVAATVGATSTKETASAGPRVFENEITEKIYNISKTLANNMFIPFELIEEFVLENTQSILERNVKYLYEKEKYEKYIEKAMEKNPKMKKISHNTYKHQIIIWTTAGMIILAVQCAIPSVRIKQTFPQCVRSFVGYPAAGGTDDAGALEYMSCVLNKTKSSVAPWDSIKSVSDHKEKIRGFLDKYVLSDEKIQNLVKKKQAYLETEEAKREQDDFPAEHKIQKWRQFLPPLVKIDVGKVRTISEEFKRELASMVRSGGKTQRQQIGVIQGKIIQFTLAIIESIHRTVKAEQPLMKSASDVPFLENSCCNERTEHDVITYFANKDPDIVKYVKSARNLEDILRHMNMRAAFLFDTRNTATKYPVIGRDYDNKELIYDAFVHYCRIGLDVPTPPELLPFCPEKFDGFKRSWSTEEKIAFFEKRGKKFTRGQLDALMEAVNAKNHVTIDAAAFEVLVDTRARKFSELLRDEAIFVFLQDDGEKFRELLDEAAAAATTNPSGSMAAATPKKPLADLRKYMDRMTTEETTRRTNMYSFIVSFFRKCAIPARDLKYYGDFLRTLDKWKTDEHENNSMDYYENMILFITKFVPNMILNGRGGAANGGREVLIPKHWNLSERHVDLLGKSLKTYNAKARFQQSVDVVQDTMSEILRIYENIDVFIKNIAFFDNSTRIMIYKYLVFSVFSDYIRIIPSTVNKNLRKIRAEEMREENADPFLGVADNIDRAEFGDLMAASASTAEREDELGGNIQELEKNVFDILKEYMNVFGETKQKINRTFKEIYDGAMNVKYREKEEMKKYFENMSQEERDVEKVLMANSLGKWNKGKQKSVHTYDKEAFDEELAVVERLLQIDGVGIIGDVGGEEGADEGAGAAAEYDIEDLLDVRADRGENMYRENMEIGDIYAEGEEPDDLQDDEDFAIGAMMAMNE